jgi:hypothetical protein
MLCSPCEPDGYFPDGWRPRQQFCALPDPGEAEQVAAGLREWVEDVVAAANKGR